MDEIKNHDAAICTKKTKNLISIAILLAGLLIGSLFIDVAQLIKGSGYSAKNLNKSEIFESSGKTWVAYSDPAVPVTIVNDDNCEKCDVSEAVVWLKRVLPTISTQKVAYDSTEGKKLIDKYSIKVLPTFIFDPAVEKTDFYSQAAVIFDQKNGQDILKNQELGLPAGKYLELPAISDTDATFGKADSNVKVVVFSDFQCPYCKILYQTLRNTMNQYKDRVAFVYKHLPLDIHAQANSSALASECAQEQGKFWEYADKLYQNQTSWSNTKDTVAFKNYARMIPGMNANQFNQCLDDKKYQDRVDTDKKEAGDFGISGTPAIFINDQFENGAMTADQLKKAIDDKLNESQQQGQ